MGAIGRVIAESPRPRGAAPDSFSRQAPTAPPTDAPPPRPRSGNGARLRQALIDAKVLVPRDQVAQPFTDAATPLKYLSHRPTLWLSRDRTITQATIGERTANEQDRAGTGQQHQKKEET